MNKKHVEFKNCTFNINVIPASENTRDEVVIEATDTDQEPSMQELVSEYLEMHQELQMKQHQMMMDALQELESQQTQSISMKQLE